MLTGDKAYLNFRMYLGNFLKKKKFKCLTGIVIGSYDDRVLTSSVLFVYDLKIENNLPSINK